MMLKTMLRKMMGRAHGPIPDKLPKAYSKLVYFNVKNTEGFWERIPGIIGQPILECLLRGNVKGLEPFQICRGSDVTYGPHERPHNWYSTGISCGKCRIVLHDNWYERVNIETEGMSQQEQIKIHQTADPKPKTRLACCVPVQSWMEGMTFQIDQFPQDWGTTQLY